MKLTEVLLISLLCSSGMVLLGDYARSCQKPAEDPPVSPRSIIALSHGEHGYSSGFVVSDQPQADGTHLVRALTCAHSIKEFPCLIVSDGEPVAEGYQVLRREQNQATDYALISFQSTRELIPLALADQAPPPETGVLGLGHPMMGPLLLWRLTLTWCDDERVTGFLMRGSSGGPVLYRGRVVGMMRGIGRSPLDGSDVVGLGFLTPLSSLREALQ